VLFTGAKPVFADIDEKTFNISPEDVAKKITRKTKAIIPVHYGGQAADMTPLKELADDNGLFLVEDAAEAHGAKYKGQKVGSFGNAGMFSFTPTKNITTGEGGMITTNDSKLDEKLRLLKNHGQIAQYYHVMLGYNYRMTEMQGAIGIEQLKKLDSIILKKQQNQEFVSKKIAEIEGLTPPYAAPDRTHTYMLYTVKLDEEKAGTSRDNLMALLKEKGIMNRIYFPPVHLQPFYKELGYKEGELPNTEAIYRSIFSLPCHSKLKKEELNYIISSLDTILTR
jgi:perosamine synthetase